LKQCKLLGDDEISMKELPKKTIKRAFYEVCYAVNHNQLKIENAVSVFSELKETFPWLPSTLADVLGIVDVETACSDELTREKFITLVGALRNTIIADGLLKERLDQDSLELVGLVSSKVGFNQKYVKTKTRLYYKQQKFNLLREESEGYSKLITELNPDFNLKISWEQVLQNIQSLIGCFDLDPNCELDIILEAFECHPEESPFYVPFLRAYIIDKLTLCHILGFKFHFRENELVDLDDLYPYLLPADSEIIPFHNKEVSDAKAYAKKLSTVILADKKEDEKKEEEQQIIDLRENIQKLGLCEALLEIGAWENARAIIDRLPENFVLVHPSISYALCSLVNRVIEPLYEKNIGLASVLAKWRVKKVESCDCPLAYTYHQLYHLAMPMLYYLVHMLLKILF
ncbi:THO complex subunit 2, partial [Biomphalaria glabrata]